MHTWWLVSCMGMQFTVDLEETEKSVQDALDLDQVA
jgi:hypothetical protein